jgi:hypothetical protein
MGEADGPNDNPDDQGPNEPDDGPGDDGVPADEPSDQPASDDSADEDSAGEEAPGDTETAGEGEATSRAQEQRSMATRAELLELREELEEFEEEIEDRTVDRESLERDLKKYVRRRVRRGHARGWGPYLVLLYGTAMTLGAFYYLGGIWAILAMLVIWLSTLGLYTLMILVGITFTAIGVPRRLVERVRNLRG